MRLLFDMRGFWVDERLEVGAWRRASPIVRIARDVERRLLLRADAIVTLTRNGADALGELLPGVRTAPVRVIPTCAALDRFKPPSDPAAARTAAGVGAGPVVMHTGTLSNWYLAEETFLIAAEFVKQCHGTFLIVTRQVDLARQLSERLNVPAVIRTAAHDEMPQWLQAGDVGLALVRPSFAKRASAPTKLGEYLGTGLAVGVTRGVGDLDSELRGHPAAVLFDADDSPVEVAHRLIAAAQHPGRVPAARALAERLYSLDDGVEQYARIYQELGVTACG